MQTRRAAGRSGRSRLRLRGLGRGGEDVAGDGGERAGMRKLSATAAREGGATAPARNGMTTGLEGHRSAPSRRRTRRPDNGRGEGAAPGDGARPEEHTSEL